MLPRTASDLMWRSELTTHAVLGLHLTAPTIMRRGATREVIIMKEGGVGGEVLRVEAREWIGDEDGGRGNREKGGE